MILFVYSRPSQFVDLDREVLSALGPVLDWPARPSLRWALRTVRAVRRSSLVFGWFAGWHTLVPAVFARLLGRPFVLVSGGFDVASVPEIGYGSQRGGWRALMARVVLRLATRIVVNSSFSAGELAANTGVSGERVVVVHHGIPDPFGSLPGVPREPVVVTAGVVDASNLSRKGLETFVAAAALVPSAQWVVIGRWEGDAVARLRALAGPNVSLTGWVTRAELDARLAVGERLRAGLPPRGVRDVGRRGDARGLHPGRHARGCAPGGRGRRGHRCGRLRRGRDRGRRRAGAPVR